MADQLLLPGGVVSMTGAAADRLIGSGSGDAALLYLLLLRRGGVFEPSPAASALKWERSRAEAAFAALVKLGLADQRATQPDSPPLAEPDEPPEYSTADISRELEDQASPFPGLVAEVQRRLGKVLSVSDLKTLYSLYDYLALPAEVILLLVNWCIEEMERKYGAGQKPRLPQIRREAFIWHRAGVDTFEAAEAYLRRQTSLRTREAAILRILGISGRAAVDKERRYLSAWVEMGFEDGAIRLAYENTVFKKQTMNWYYMNSILKSWHEKGLHTVAEIGEKDSAKPYAPAPASPAQPGEADRRAREDWERMREFMKKQREEEAPQGE